MTISPLDSDSIRKRWKDLRENGTLVVVTLGVAFSIFSSIMQSNSSQAVLQEKLSEISQKQIDDEKRQDKTEVMVSTMGNDIAGMKKEVEAQTRSVETLNRLLMEADGKK